MTHRLRHLFTAGRLLGFDLQRFRQTIASTPKFVVDAAKYVGARSPEDRFPFELSGVLPMLTDASEQAGEAGGMYFLQDLWASRLIFARRPQRHVDVGSRIDGFVAHLLTFMDVEVVDIRPLESRLRGLRFIQDDATTLASLPDASVGSLSSLNALEHFGLGRYGDPISPSGWRDGMRALCRVLAPGGFLYFAVPVGEERLRFNAHRVFGPRTVLDSMPELELVSFSAIDDSGSFVESTKPDNYDTSRMSCGLFELRKRAREGSV